MPFFSDSFNKDRSKSDRRAEKAERLRDKQEQELRERHASKERKEREGLEPEEMIKKGYTIMTTDNDEIASGTFSNIYRAKHNNEDIAVRIIEKEGKDEVFMKKFLPRFVKILRLLNSHFNNIIAILDVFETDKRVLVFMEFATNGTLREYLRRDKALLNEKGAKKFARDIGSGLCYLHINGLAHRDLRSVNILITEDLTAKISGFTYSRPCIDPISGTTALSETIGKVLHPYCPPEHLSGVKYDPRASDIWSYGVILFMIMNKKYPFDSDPIHVLVGQQRKGEWRLRMRNDTSNHVKNLFEKCFTLNFKERITIIDVLRHPWMECSAIINPEEPEDDDFIEPNHNEIRADILSAVKNAFK